MTICRTQVLSAQLLCDKVIRLDLAVPEQCTWKTGEFARLAPVTDGEPQWRCYSIASPAGSDRLTFFIALVKGGAVSPAMHRLRAGDEVMLDTEMNGMLLEDRLEAGGRDLWLFATGTGVAPFIGVAADAAIMGKYKRVILVHGVSHWAETSYVGRHITLADNLTAVACVTREPGAMVPMRIPEALTSGKLEEVVGVTISAKKSRAMICGNPAMSKAVRAALKERGLVSPRQGNPGQVLVENFWM